MNEITYKESLSLENRQYIDVRSPVEFKLDSIPGSVNIPVFSNSERSEVGKIYRESGKDPAIIKGSEFVGEKLGDIVNGILVHREKNLVITCARGGMRSGAVTSLINSLGIKALKLKSGYKGYRQYIVERLESLEIKPVMVVIHGLTGTGKTEVIRHMDYSLDLEKYAGHRSSIFGGIGLQQKTQKEFESSIIRRIDELDSAPYILVEGESKKVGNLHIPPAFFKIMNDSPSILLTAEMEQRTRIISDEYSSGINKEYVKTIVNSLKSKMGKPTIDRLLHVLENDNYDEFISILLERYYDPLYLHKLDKKKYLAVINYKGPVNTVKQIVDCIENYLKG